MSDSQRPLSPHLSAYRWRITSALSILHRAAGVFMSLGAIVLVAWLLALAAGVEPYERFADALSSVSGQLFLILVSAAWLLHLMNGIRHLFWDAGMGFEIETARRSGWFVVLGTAALTTILWWAVLA